MPTNSNSLGVLLSLPKERHRRKRAIRRIFNVAFIIVFSLLVAYVLTRPVGGTGFSLPKSATSVPAQSVPPAKK